MALSPPLTASVFVGNDFLGTFTYEARNYYPFSYLSKAYFCPQCGEVWARVVVGEHPFYPFYSHCEAHAGIAIGGGSLISHMAVFELQAHWPAEVWHREVRLWAQQVNDWSVDSESSALFQLP